MEFLNKIRSKLKVKNFMWMVLFLALAAVFAFVAFQNGFSSDMQWQIGIRGSRSGIPVPNWLISGFMLVLSGVFLVSACAFFSSFVKNTEFNRMFAVVQSMGDPEIVGAMLASMEKSKHAKGGDLRFNQYIIFYMAGTDVTILHPALIRGIRTEIVGGRGGETNFVCVYHTTGVLKIKTSAKTVLPLLEEMRACYTPVA